jgi:hypothetical protein
MPHGPHRSSTVSRLLLEGLVVIASILIAFALDAWWADRQLTGEVVVDLQGVDRELAANVELVAFQIHELHELGLPSQ